MSRVVFDIETDGLLDTLTTIHSLVIKDIDTGEVLSLHGRNVDQGLARLSEADLIIGHNVIKFDLPAILKVHPEFTYDPSKVHDTIVLSRLIWPQIVDTDLARIRRGDTTLTMKLAGSHSLEAWGHRVGKWKGDYAKIMEDRGLDPWAEWSQEMQDYCEQDIEVTEALYRLIEAKDYSPQAIDLEHKTAFIIAQMERNGFRFDVKAAEALYVELAALRADLGESLRDIFKPWWVRDGDVTTPKRPNKTLGYGGYKDDQGVFHGYPYQKIKLQVFNPNSRDHIANRLMTIYGWKPEEMTPTGKPKVDEKILSPLPYPEAQELARYMMLQKRIGQLSEGDEAWTKHVKNDGRIYGSVITNGAVTGRATHSKPNIAQVPKVKVKETKNADGTTSKSVALGLSGLFGHECRSLFTGTPGQTVLLGCDCSGLEYRMLAHFLAKYDGGAYGDVVINGDIHSVNQKAAGLPTRDLAKTFAYAVIYGGGDAKIGSLIGKGRVAGRELKKRFFKGIPGMDNVVKGVKHAVETTRSLKGLDGRKLPIRKDHAALNTLLQSAGALVCKQWIVEFDALLREHGLHDRVKLVAWVHDEIQMEVPLDLVREDNTSLVGELCVKAIVNAGNRLGIRVPLSGEYKIGPNWAATH